MIIPKTKGIKALDSMATKITASLLQNPMKGGKPTRLSAARVIAMNVVFIWRAKPPMSSTKRECTACITAPAAKNKEALNMAWLIR